MLGEPTNDLDTDMLAAIEDLLDSWPGTLIVVSHDRYFLERVTDQQYAILDRRLRHLPGGVDEYLKLRSRSLSEAKPSGNTASPRHSAGAERVAESQERSEILRSPSGPQDDGKSVPLSGSELRAAEKELASVERRLEKMQQQAAKDRDALASLDQSDYQLLNVEMTKIAALEDEIAGLEERWLELSELLG